MCNVAAKSILLSLTLRYPEARIQDPDLLGAQDHQPAQQLAERQIRRGIHPSRDALHAAIDDVILSQHRSKTLPLDQIGTRYLASVERFRLYNAPAKPEATNLWVRTRDDKPIVSISGYGLYRSGWAVITVGYTPKRLQGPPEFLWQTPIHVVIERRVAVGMPQLHIRQFPAAIWDSFIEIVRLHGDLAGEVSSDDASARIRM
jgi:hypothetical protein